MKEWTTDCLKAMDDGVQKVQKDDYVDDDTEALLTVSRMLGL